MLTEKELIQLKEKIDKAQELKNRYEGQLEQLYASLRDLGYESVEEARKDLEKLKESKHDLEQRITELEEELTDLLVNS